jgi:cell division protein FtsZ
MMGIGRAQGENRALEAARAAVASPLLEVNISGAQGILFNICGSANLTLWEVTEAAEEIRGAADPEANIIFGTSFNERLGEEVMITVIATGFDARRSPTSARAATTDRDRGAYGTRQASAGSQQGASVPARDFLDELERQRTDVADPDVPRVRDEQAAVPVRAESRSVGEPPVPKKATTYDADDLEIPSFLRRR